MLHRHEASVEEGRVEGGRVDDGNKRGRNGVKRPLSLLRKGSASTRLWESPRVPSERYEPRPCLCVFVACFDCRIFYYSSKTDSWWGCVAKVTASHLLMAPPRHCLSAIHGWALPKQ